MITEKSVLAGPFKTSYIEAGDPTNPTIVLIHDGAFGTTADLCWGAVAGGLADQYHVVAPDLLGWGATDKVVYFDRSPYAPRIAHVKLFLETIGVSNAYFAGASFGGSMILRALTDSSQPWAVDKAVTLSGTGGPFRLASGIEALADYNPSLEAAARLTSLVVTSLKGLEDHVKVRYENSLLPGHWEALSAPRLHNPALKRQTRSDPFLESLAKVVTPVLFVEGRNDQLLEDGWAAKLSKLTPDSTHIILEYGHEPNIEDPGAVVKILKEYFGAGA